MFRMPIESDAHQRTFMQWLAEPQPSREKQFDSERECIVQIARAIARFEPIVILARPDQLAQAAAAIGNCEAIDYWDVPVDDLWCRDSGPTFVQSSDGRLAVSDLNFNGWGGKQRCTFDKSIAATAAERLGIAVLNSGLVGEGGGFEVDGEGTILAHESSWINANRNRQSKAEISQLLARALGAETVIWAPGVVRADDITDFHIDALARFVRPGLVIMQLPRKRGTGGAWGSAAFETYDVLKTARDCQGRRIEIEILHDPDWSKIRVRRLSFVASYVNYYVCNSAVICSEFGDDKSDVDAAHVLGQLYPGRQVIPLDTDPLGNAGGGIHCVTQQQPLGH